VLLLYLPLLLFPLLSLLLFPLLLLLYMCPAGCCCCHCC
jgi:hypothetical protein